MTRPRLLALLAASLVLAACDRLGLPDPARDAAAKEAEAHAIGGGCRHVGRSLEDCYARNTTASKAAIFGGWREMNDYMSENKIETMPLPREAAEAPPAEAASAPEEAADSAPRSSRRRAPRS